jgi:hypothetical protein
MGFPVQ